MGTASCWNQKLAVQQPRGGTPRGAIRSTPHCSHSRDTISRPVAQTSKNKTRELPVYPLSDPRSASVQSVECTTIERDKNCTLNRASSHGLHGLEPVPHKTLSPTKVSKALLYTLYKGECSLLSDVRLKEIPPWWSLGQQIQHKLRGAARDKWLTLATVSFLCATEQNHSCFSCILRLSLLAYIHLKQILLATYFRHLVLNVQKSAWRHTVLVVPLHVPYFLFYCCFT